ncbi:beta-ketoacyl-[acyl-carrier-protein] synthase family protein [Salibacterium sp. K-3]
MPKRAVVTGVGVVSPIGSSTDEFWANLCDGKKGNEQIIESFDTEDFSVNIGGEVKDFDPTLYFENLDPNLYGRTTQLAVAAAKMALRDSKVNMEEVAADTSVCIGTTMGNNSILEKHHDFTMENNEKYEKGSYIPQYPLNIIPAAVSEEIGSEGSCMVIPTACAAGNYAIGFGKDLIEDGKAKVAVVGGADAMSRVIYTTFHRLGALSDQASRPFDKNRDGINVSEGSGVLLLEEYEHAVNRGATIYAEVKGYGLACDAYHRTAPHPEGEGAVNAMEKALVDANISRGDISYVNAHGTGTAANDHTESIAIRRVFEDQANELPISSIKSMLGHTMGAASGVESVCCTLAIYHSVRPPTMNYSDPDPECIQNVVPNKSQPASVGYAISNSFAFGGNVCNIILGRYSHE